MNKEQLAELILDILMKQSFERWHSTQFQDYITGEENAPSKAEILKELEWQVGRELQREQQTREAKPKMTFTYYDDKTKAKVTKAVNF
jgi:hypothetical protein